jgi:uncharacterized protein (TIGR02588 family)
MNQAGEDHHQGTGQHVPWLEWLASAIGLLLVAGIFGFIGWQALDDPNAPPMITVEIEAVTPVGHGYRVGFRARNSAGSAAAQVEIEGRITGREGAVETSRTTLDYLPGHSSRQGGLFFSLDPRVGDLSLRAGGFAKP